MVTFVPGKEPLHRVGHDVRGRVADDVEPVRVGRADDLELRVGGDRRHQVVDAPSARTAMTSLARRPSCASRSRGVKNAWLSGMGNGR